MALALKADHFRNRSDPAVPDRARGEISASPAA